MWRSVVAVMVLVGVGLGQGVALPLGTGRIVPAAEWTVLQKAELDQAERSTDPLAAAARTWLGAILTELKDKQRTDQNVVLHRLGSDEEHLQLIHCYSADARASSSELLSKQAVEQIRDALIQAMTTPELVAVCSGFETSQLWSVPSLLLHFRHEAAASPWRMDMHIVPAGDRLQYFESQYLADDASAVQNIQEVLRTFDGAKEPESRASNLLIGGLAGAVAGVLTALYRRKRQQDRAMAAGS